MKGIPSPLDIIPGNCTRWHRVRYHALEFLAEGLLPPLHSKASFLFYSLLHPERKVSRQAGDWTVLHCAHRTSTFPSCEFCEQEGWSSYPLHFLPHILPIFRHLRLPRCLAFGRFRHHHGFEAPLQKRFSKNLRTPNPCLELLPSCQMHFIEFCT
jgi:hypothetical protein